MCLRKGFPKGWDLVYNTGKVGWDQLTESFEYVKHSVPTGKTPKFSEDTTAISTLQRRTPRLRRGRNLLLGQVES